MDGNGEVEPPDQPRKIAYWMSERKCGEFNMEELQDILRGHGLELVKVDLDQPLDKQGPFAVFLHKLAPFLLASEAGNAQAKEKVKTIEAYLKRHPETVMLDPFPNVERLHDRRIMYSAVENSDLNKIDHVFVPSFVELNATDVEKNLEIVTHAGITFPMVMKPMSAPEHQMWLVFGPQGLKDIQLPCVAMTFVNHNALLYKVFVIGHHYEIVERPSIRNLQPSDTAPTIEFNSHSISKPDSDHPLTVKEEDDEKAIKKEDLDIGLFDRIVHHLREDLGLMLFGVDVVIEKGTGKHAIIDINVFPGYSGVADVMYHLSECILTCDAEAGSELSDVVDSGIEMGYSSDEKQKLPLTTVRPIKPRPRRPPRTFGAPVSRAPS